MDKKAIVKKCVGKGGCGKGGPGDFVAGLGKKVGNVGKAAVEGAKDAYQSNLNYDKKVLGFNDPASYLKGGAMGVLGGVIGAGKGIKKELDEGKKKSILKGSLKIFPTRMPINAPRQMPVSPKPYNPKIQRKTI